jgi:hypothetical protein
LHCAPESKEGERFKTLASNPQNSLQHAVPTLLSCAA